MTKSRKARSILGGRYLFSLAGCLFAAAGHAANAPAAVASVQAQAAAPKAAAAAQLQLYADTDHPDNSTYTIGQQVNLCVLIQGLANSDSLQLVVKDADGNTITSATLAVTPSNGSWLRCMPAPSTRLGYFRVGIDLLHANATLPTVRSRPGGYLTYAIVPDPKQRVLYPSDQTFFGMQYPATFAGLAPYLGIRWVLASYGYAWRYGEPQYPGQFAAQRAKDPTFPGADDSVKWAGGTWQQYEIPTLFMYPVPDAQTNAWQTNPLPVILSTANFLTAALTEGNPAGVTWWAAFVQQSVQAFVDLHPSSIYKQRIYQITWEPRYHGTFDQITRIYQIAYPLIHAIDPEAIVAGPTASAMNNNQRMFELTRFFKADLLKYVDALAMHTYTVWPPEEAYSGSVSDPNPQSPPGPYYTLAQSIQLAKQNIRATIGHDLPMYSTEFGGNTKCPDSSLNCLAQELPQAQGLIRENLILMGEGFKAAVSFYGSDYQNGSEIGYYGLYYNLDPNHDWYSPNKLGPKPSAAAYAAMSFLLEGHHGVKPVTGLGSTVVGYAYARSGSTVLALWDYYNAQRWVSVDTGVAQVVVYDWMGNSQTVKTTNGVLNVPLSKDPVYVTGVSAAKWGDGSPGAAAQ